MIKLHITKQPTLNVCCINKNYIHLEYSKSIQTGRVMNCLREKSFRWILKTRLGFDLVGNESAEGRNMYFQGMISKAPY